MANLEAVRNESNKPSNRLIKPVNLTSTKIEIGSRELGTQPSAMATRTLTEDKDCQTLHVFETEREDPDNATFNNAAQLTFRGAYSKETCDVETQTDPLVIDATLDKQPLADINSKSLYTSVTNTQSYPSPKPTAQSPQDKDKNSHVNSGRDNSVKGSNTNTDIKTAGVVSNRKKTQPHVSTSPIFVTDIEVGSPSPAE